MVCPPPGRGSFDRGAGDSERGRGIYINESHIAFDDCIVVGEA